MRTHTFQQLHLVTRLEVWTPRYSDQYKTGERVALLARYKVDHGSSWIIVDFTRAKHLKGQRYCISRQDAQACPIDSNGTIECYAVPMSALIPWDTHDEVMETVNDIWPRGVDK